MQLRGSMIALAALTALSACQANEEDTTDGDFAEPAATQTPVEGESVSILRPDIEQVEAPPPPLEDLRTTVGFPDGGTELDSAAVDTLQSIIDSDQIDLGGAIVLRGHSDAGGRDTVNERVSRERAEAVRDWLVENGIAGDRIEIIAFGEQNPVEPNAMPDGTPNEEGRAANRRVEISIPVAVVKSGEAETSTETAN